MASNVETTMIVNGTRFAVEEDALKVSNQLFLASREAENPSNHVLKIILLWDR